MRGFENLTLASVLGQVTILFYFSPTPSKSVYLPEVLYKMRVGGVSNGNLNKICQKMSEDMLGIRQNRVGGVSTLAFKGLLKVCQFFVG